MTRIELLKRLEWSGCRFGPGNGPMFSGGDGNEYAACPYCHGLEEPNREFDDSAVGHRPDCPFLTIEDSP